MTANISRNMFAVILLTGVVFVSSLVFGTTVFDLSQIFKGLFIQDSGFERAVIWEMRFPRSLSAALVGASLGLAGAILQITTRNPLADPAILGISALSGLILAIVTVIIPSAHAYLRVVACVAGGVCGSLLILQVSNGMNSPLRITMVGFAIGAFASACIVGLITGSRVVLEFALGFLAGGLYGTSWNDAVLWVLWLPVVIVVLIALMRRLNNLSLGDDIAQNLGEKPARTRAYAIIFCGFITGIAVSISGLVSFVGLASPHIAGNLVGRNGFTFLFGSMLSGMFIVLGADTFARVIISPSELPAGILTAIIGAPILVYLVRKEV